MKKILFAALLMATSFSIFANPAQTTVQSASTGVVTEDLKEIPKKSRDFISLHFGDLKISHIKTEGKLLWREYDVIFTNGMKVEFDNEGDWKEIKSKNAVIPSSVLPVGVNLYLGENYTDKKINKIEVKRYGYEVKLDKGPELKFNQTGNFIGFDD